ncbi:zinc finger protein 618 isoform X2 [Erpetoichthys calabaricus]|uniref:zinc finger protein 618 isoform X2 n=1 Tax=Erpetoichthys calabaricus TaxID=27687 RepID=UPI00109F4767|nr:zinc finger protein 618 isoform X2 [Erpetoichthys calabaricus]
MNNEGNQKPNEAGPQCSAGSMSSLMAVKSEIGEDYNFPEASWQVDTKDKENNSKNSSGDLPAEICVVIGGSRNSQTIGSYVCGVCGKKYKYYNCFQTHVRAHTETEPGAGEGGSQGVNNNFRYACDICGKKYKYYSCFQEHRDLHAVDESGNYVCEFCGKQYKYFNPYQEHVALHAPPNKAGWSAEKQASFSKLRLVGNNKHGAPKPEYNRMDTAFCRKVENKIPNSVEESNSSRNSNEPYTCGACGIQFQFYNNLLEHMQSHAADNENTVGKQRKASPVSAPTPSPASAPVPASAPSPATTQSPALSLPSASNEKQWKYTLQRNHTTNSNSSLPEKERQQIAERLVKVMYSDLGAISILNGKDFMKLAQTLIDSGARYGAFSVRDVLGDMNMLALKHLPRMYNQVKVKVTCALGSNTCLGIGVTCHSQNVGSDSCYVLTAYQAEGTQMKRYVLGIKDVDVKEGSDQVHHWVQNVLSEFIMSEIRTIYVTDCKVSSAAFSKAGMCLRCSACALNLVVQSVLNRRTLQARNMHEVIELLNVCEEMAGSAGFTRETFGYLEETPPPPCWDSVTDSLLLVNERYEQICEFYSRAKKMSHIQNLNKHLLNNMAAILAPVKQAVVELSCEQKPTLQLVLPMYVRLEKLFTAKANDITVVSKLCHFFLEALKENFKVERAHKVAMILDPQQKLRPVPPYQHEEIISKVCEMIAEIREISGEDSEVEPSPKKARGVSNNGKAQGNDEQQVKNEVYEYLAEPLFQATPDLFHYWSSVTQKYPRLAKLAFWLLSVPAVGARSESVSMCEQALSMKKKRQVTPEEMNKLIFLKSNMP